MKGSWGGAEAGAQGEGQGPAVIWDGHRVTAGSPLPAQGSVLFRWAGRLLTAWPTAGLLHKKLPPSTPCFAQHRCRCQRGLQGLVFSRQEEGRLWGDGGAAGGRWQGLLRTRRPPWTRRYPRSSAVGRAQPPRPRLQHPWLDQDASQLPRTRASSHNQARENEFCPSLFHGLSGHLDNSRERSHRGCLCSLCFWPPLPRGPIHKEVVLASGDPSGHSPFIKRSTHPYPPATAPRLLSQARVLRSS